jgi:hypothetical protein
VPNEFDHAANTFVIQTYQDLISSESPRQALTNALVRTYEKFRQRNLAALNLVAWAVDAVIGFPEPEQIDVIVADVWRNVAVEDDEASRPPFQRSGGDTREPTQTKKRPGRPTRRRKLQLKTWGGIPLVVLDDERLSKTDIRAFGYVASHIATNGSKEYSYGALAERLGVTRREAIRSVGTLTGTPTGRKYLLVKERGTGRRGNVYAFGPDALAEGEVEK